MSLSQDSAIYYDNYSLFKIKVKAKRFESIAPVRSVSFFETLGQYQFSVPSSGEWIWFFAKSRKGFQKECRSLRYQYLISLQRKKMVAKGDKRLVVIAHKDTGYLRTLISDNQTRSIAKFQRKIRYNLENTKGLELNHFLTLTVNDENRYIDFSWAVRRFFARINQIRQRAGKSRLTYAWRIEEGSKNQRPHVHIVSNLGFMPKEEIEQFWPYGYNKPEKIKNSRAEPDDVQVSLDTMEKVVGYVCKYMGKSDEEAECDLELPNFKASRRFGFSRDFQRVPHGWNSNYELRTSVDLSGVHYTYRKYLYRKTKLMCIQANHQRDGPTELNVWAFMWMFKSFRNEMARRKRKNKKYKQSGSRFYYKLNFENMEKWFCSNVVVTTTIMSPLTDQFCEQLFAKMENKKCSSVTTLI